ncbi:DUF1033 family protein [Enterococcus cecorum]
MYQVIRMHGDNEVWWFFEGWQEDIVEEQYFATFEEAVATYTLLWNEYKIKYSCVSAKENYLCAFWNEEELRYCEECEDDLQQYHSIALLKDFEPVTITSERNLYETANHCGKTKCCQRSE